MRGASALEKVLEQEPGQAVRAFVVWEPILWTDLGPPSTRRLATMPDARVRQFWDPDHVVSGAILSSAWAAKEGIAVQGTEVRGTKVAWDLVLLFPPGSCGRALPEPVFHGDPVVTRARELEGHLRALLHP